MSVSVQIDNREFTVTGALDSLTARRVDAGEARARRILVDAGDAGPTSPTRLRPPTTPSARSPASRGSSPRPPDDDADDYDYYLVEATGERIPLLEAIDAGWVFVEYEVDEEHAPPEVEVGLFVDLPTSSMTSLNSYSDVSKSVQMAASVVVVNW